MAKSSHVVITVVSVKCFMVLCGVCDVDMVRIGWVSHLGLFKIIKLKY